MDSEAATTGNHTAVERQSETELVVKRTFDAPARLVFQAWTTPETFIRWWVPKSFGMTVLSYEADFRTGGTYRLVFKHPQFDQPMPFFGTYIEVTPHSRIVWSNDESGDAGSVTTVILEEANGRTYLVLTDKYQSKQALDEAMESGSTGAFPEQFEALDAVLASLEKDPA